MNFSNIIDVFDILNKFTLRSTEIRDIHELAMEVKHILDEMINMEYNGLFLYDFNDRKLKLYYAKGFSEEERIEAERTAMERHPGFVFKTGKTFYVPDIESNNPPLSITSKRSFQIRTRLSIPVFNREHVVGVFSIASPEKNKFSKEQIALFSLIGNLAGSIYGHILNRSYLESTTSRLSTLMRNLHDGILVEDENSKIVLVNNEFCHLFNVPLDPERLVGLDYSVAHEMITDFVKEPLKFQKKVDKILSLRQLAIHEEVELTNGHVYERDFLPMYSGIKFMGNLWRYSDITPRKKAERELKKAQLEAISASIAKSQFLVNMSHEIRTPLHAINGLTRLLEETPMTDEQKKLIKGLDKSYEGLLGIVNDILEFSEIEAGQVELNETEFSLEDLLKKVFDAFEYTAAEKKIKLEIKFDKEIKCLLLGDRIRLRQVFVNLLNNALKFTQKGCVCIECSLVKSTKNSYIIYFNVSDTGIGITKENIPKIFQSFHQEYTGTTRGFGGMGLGLAISMQLVELMGGKLEVKSQKNQGSEFFFTLSFIKVRTKVKTKKIGPVKIYTNLFQGVRALLVEDTKLNQIYAKSIMEKWNMVVVIANNGKEALEKLREQTFHIVLMDLQMPEMGGLEATSKIRTELKLDVPVIAVTANVVKGVIEECLSVGMNDYIPKPFNPDDLAKKIRNFVKPKN